MRIEAVDSKQGSPRAKSKLGLSLSSDGECNGIMSYKLDGWTLTSATQCKARDMPRDHKRSFGHPNVQQCGRSCLQTNITEQETSLKGRLLVSTSLLFTSNDRRAGSCALRHHRCRIHTQSLLQPASASVQVHTCNSLKAGGVQCDHRATDITSKL